MYSKILRFIFFCILLFCFWYSFDITRFKDSVFQKRIENRTVFSVDSFDSLPTKEITIQQAIDLGIQQAKEYDKNPLLINMASVDDGKISGLDGKKANWNGMFSLPNAKYRMATEIKNGKLKKYIILDTSSDIPFKRSDITINSNDIVNLAVKRFALRPSFKKPPFKLGYHFQILRDDEQRPFFIIEGQTKSGKYMEIYYDPSAGEYLGKGVQENDNN
ncbi:hypothetical protein [Rummeliibacillus pycnus]|uniref:hypothetical protein n=1 Tax=Rummeliibacillus pycnus TaxID=101070 RepID=UPI003D2809B3